MSRDLYPSNSNIIDLRSKILPTQAPLKTKQFINELDRLSSTPLGQKERNLSSGITYENERWFSPRFNADMNISLPPRRSIFTPSRLSSRRIRESTKPYWRCPQPVSTSSTSNWYNTTIASMGKSSDNSSSVGNAATSINKSLSLDKPVSVCNVLSMDNMGVITSVNNTVTTFTDNAPSVGYITRVEDKGIDNAIDQEDEIAIVSTPADVQPAFTFADSIIRNPKCPTPPKPKPIYHDKEVQTDVVQTVNGSLQNSIANNIVDKMPVVAKLFEEPPAKQNLFDSVVTAPLSTVPLTTAPAVSVPSAPVANVFQPPLAPLNGGSIQFGTSSLSHASNDSSMAVEPSTQQNSTCVPLFGVGLTTNGVSVNNAVFAPVISSAPFSGGFQFNPNPINGGVFQFSSSTSEVSNGSTFTNGLATRSSVLTRKVLHAKRSRKH